MNPEQAKSLIQLWRASLLSVSESMPPTPRQIADPHRNSLRKLAGESIAPEKLVEILSSYGSQMGNYIEAQNKESKAVLNSVSQLTETLSSFDQRYSVKFQGIAKKLRQLGSLSDVNQIQTKLAAEVTQLERTIEELHRNTRSAMQRLSEEVSNSEVRRQRSIPGPGSQHASDSLVALDRAVQGWDRYCLVRYEFQTRDAQLWQAREPHLLEALPERVGHNVRVVVPKPGVLLAAIDCQLLEYAGQAESMEKSLGQLTGVLCTSRVVEPMRGEDMREAMARLEKAG